MGGVQKAIEINVNVKKSDGDYRSSYTSPLDNFVSNTKTGFQPKIVLIVFSLRD